MKNTRTFQLFMIVCFLLGYSFASAQQNYVVTIKSDTIRGTVKYLNYGNEEKVQVTPTGGKKVTYSILQTREFMLDGERYHPVRFTTGYTYMKLIKQGYLSLYAYQLPNQHLWDGRYLLKKDGSGKDVPNLGFKKAMNNFLGDCESINAKIESGELSKNNIEAIVDVYNDCITKKSMPSQKAETPAVVVVSSVWSDLEKNVKALENFDQKNDALEMIRDIQTKLNRGEKVPSFLVNGLKDTLKDQSAVKDVLDKAVAELN